ncbi:MAG: mannose-1-phosphate guanylyltransferase [Chitinivibrionales bacterium]
MYHAVIMAGGSGTRLWPLSRKKSPKQALKLIGERTMLNHAVDRITALFGPGRIVVVTRDEHYQVLSGQTPELPPDNFILEPIGRGTGPAIGLAAIHLRKKDPDATMAVLTADHFIEDTARFRQALAFAAKVAANGHLVTLGIKPSSASTGFGYIKQGKNFATVDDFPVFGVERFIEKPDQETATSMVKSGDYAWNSGMFIWRVDRILEEFKRQMPDFYAQLSLVEAALGTPDYQATINRVWPQVAKETIDYGIMEGAKDVAVIPVDIGWSDVGSWGSLFELLSTDKNGNIIVGSHVGIDTRGSLVFGKKRLIATIGLKDMIVVDTEDAVLVCPKDREQEVRDIVERLGKDGLDAWS